MIKKELKYLEILKLFNESNFDEVEKRFGYRFLFYFILSLYTSVSLISLFYFTKYSSIISLLSGILLISIILIYVYFLNRRIIRYFGKDCESFIKQNRLHWKGARALIFFEKLQEKGYANINEKTLLKKVNIEIKLKNYNIFKKPFFLVMIPLGIVLFDNFFEKLDLYYISWIVFIYIIIFILFVGYFKGIRSEESKMDDLKLFVLWYKEIYPDIKLNKCKTKLNLEK